MLQRLHALRRFGVRPGLDAIRALLDAARQSRARAARHSRRRHQRQGLDGGDDRGGRSRRRQARRALHLAAPAALHRAHSPSTARSSARDRVAALAERVLAVAGEHTFFEVATAMALLAFAEARVDVAVLEVGLGGRLDATNVVERPRCSIVTRWRSITPSGARATPWSRSRARRRASGSAAVRRCTPATTTTAAALLAGGGGARRRGADRALRARLR